MLISVLDDFGKEVFHGEAEEFLFKKENDVELEILLDRLENKWYNEFVAYEELEIYKLNPWEDEL